jgi:hypothetical protein
MEANRHTPRYKPQKIYIRHWIKVIDTIDILLPVVSNMKLVDSQLAPNHESDVTDTSDKKAMNLLFHLIKSLKYISSPYHFFIMEDYVVLPPDSAGFTAILIY